MEKISDYVLCVLWVITTQTGSRAMFGIQICWSIDATTLVIKLKLTDKSLVIFPQKGSVVPSFLPVSASQI